MRALELVTGAALLIACAGGSSKPDTKAEYEPMTAAWYQDYEFTVGAAAPVTVRYQNVAETPGGFTRRMYTPDGGYGETTFVLVDGSTYGEVRTRYTQDGTLTTTDTFSPPYMSISADDTPGHVDTTVSTVTSVSTFGGETTYESTRTVTVDGPETVTVPAGTYTALKTTAHITDTLGTDNYNVNWWAPGIGRVKIVSYAAADPTAASTWLLRMYGTADLP